MAISYEIYLAVLLPSFVAFAGIGVAWGQFMLAGVLSLESAIDP